MIAIVFVSVVTILPPDDRNSYPLLLFAYVKSAGLSSPQLAGVINASAT